MEAATEALGPHSGQQAIFIISSGYSERSIGDIFRNIDVPVFVLAPGFKEDWAYFSWESGGMYEDLALLMSGKLKSNELRALPLSQTQIAYVSTLPVSDQREIELFAPNLQNDGPLVATNTQAPAKIAAVENLDGSPLEKSDNNWLLFGIPIFFGFVALIYLIRFFLFRTSKGTVLPGITLLEYNAKKHVLQAQVNIPIRTKPAKFTLHNHSGTPVRDQIISGTTRKVKMNLEGLPKGVYKCSLSNAGMTSEQQEIVFG